MDGKVEIHIPVITLVKLVAAIALVAALLKLMPLFILLFLAVLLAVTLYPIVTWLQRHRIKKAIGVILVAFTMAALLVLATTLIIPPLADQIGNLIQDLPQLRAKVMEQVPETSLLHFAARHALGKHGLPDPTAWLQHIVAGLQLATEGVSALLVVLIFSIYLLWDGRKSYAWLLAFFSADKRAKINQTMDETAEVVFAYVAGQVITSTLSAIYAFACLSLLHVPASLILAALAGILDVLPILGFFLSTIPAVLLALTVSPGTALAVFLLYLLYHGIENYLIVPRVYGKRLRLSTLAVLLALMIGGLLGGILGAIAILPIVASYPIIERIWLVKYLGQTVVQKHEAVEARPH